MLILQRKAGSGLGGSWNIQDASYDNVSISAGDSQPEDVFISPDGTKLYVAGSANDNVVEFTLSIPNDLSSATQTNLMNVGSYNVSMNGIRFKPDGTSLFITGGNGNIDEFALTSPWDTSVTTHSSTTSIGSNQGLHFSPNGMYMYIIASAGFGQNNIKQYTLSPVWSVSSATLTNNIIIPRSITGITFKNDGSKMFATAGITNTIHQYTLSTPWAIQTAVEDAGNASGLANHSGLFFSNNGEKMFISVNGPNTINQYTVQS